MQAGVWFFASQFWRFATPSTGLQIVHLEPQTETPVLGTVHGDELQIFLITFPTSLPKGSMYGLFTY